MMFRVFNICLFLSCDGGDGGLFAQTSAALGVFDCDHDASHDVTDSEGSCRDDSECQHFLVSVGCCFLSAYILYVRRTRVKSISKKNKKLF